MNYLRPSPSGGLFWKHFLAPNVLQKVFWTQSLFDMIKKGNFWTPLSIASARPESFAATSTCRRYSFTNKRPLALKCIKNIKLGYHIIQGLETETKSSSFFSREVMVTTVYCFFFMCVLGALRVYYMKHRKKTCSWLFIYQACHYQIFITQLFLLFLQIQILQKWNIPSNAFSI